MPIPHFIDYLTLEKKYSIHTVEAYRNDLQSFQDFCVSTYDHKDLIEMNNSLIRGWIVSMVEAGLSNRSINRKLSALKAFYKYLLRKLGEFRKISGGRTRLVIDAEKPKSRGVASPSPLSEPSNIKRHDSRFGTGSI